MDERRAWIHEVPLLKFICSIHKTGSSHHVMSNSHWLQIFRTRNASKPSINLYIFYWENISHLTNTHIFLPLTIKNLIRKLVLFYKSKMIIKLLLLFLSIVPNQSIAVSHSMVKGMLKIFNKIVYGLII